MLRRSRWPDLAAGAAGAGGDVGARAGASALARPGPRAPGWPSRSSPTAPATPRSSRSAAWPPTGSPGGSPGRRAVEVVDVGALYVRAGPPTGQPTDPLSSPAGTAPARVVAGSYYLADRHPGGPEHAWWTSRPAGPPDGDAGARAGGASRSSALELLQQQVMTAVAGALDVGFRPFTARPSAPAAASPPTRRSSPGRPRTGRGVRPPRSRDFFQHAAASDSTFLTRRGLARLRRRQRRGVRADRLGRRARSVAGAAALDRVRPAHARHQRGPLPQRLARGASAWRREQAALRPRSTYAVYTAGFFALTSGPLAGGARLPPQHRPGARARLALGLGQERLLARPHRQRRTCSASTRRSWTTRGGWCARFPTALAPTSSPPARSRGWGGRTRRSTISERRSACRRTRRLARRSARAPGRSATPRPPSCGCMATPPRRASPRGWRWTGIEGGEDRLSGRYERLQLARAHVLWGSTTRRSRSWRSGPRPTRPTRYYLALRGVAGREAGRRSSVGEIDAQLAAIVDPAMQSLVETAPRPDRRGARRPRAGDRAAGEVAAERGGAKRRWETTCTRIRSTTRCAAIRDSSGSSGAVE